MSRGLKGLVEKVLSQGLCTSCGACLSLCPYLRSWQGRVVKVHDCSLEDGRCFAYCPRTEFNFDGIEKKGVHQPYQHAEIGSFRRVLMARAKDSTWRERAQSGGTVSALIDFAIRKKVIDAAILTLRDGDSSPKGQIVMDREDILNHAGSSYVSGPTLEALHRGPWEGEEKIGVVGLPCQVQAVSKMRASTLEKKTPIDKIRLMIGLFCTWALEDEPFRDFLKKRIGNWPALKLEITPPPERLLKIHTTGGLYIVPVDEIRPFIRKGCEVCSDMTAELADISAGTVEGIDGWNTVIVRSDQGEKLFKEAEAEGIIESQPLPMEHLNHLKEASLFKKERAVKNFRNIE